VEQLPEIPIRLEDPGALDLFFKLDNHALQQRREQKGREHLRDLEEDVARSHRLPRERSAATKT
jgi:hypothetical protein